MLVGRAVHSEDQLGGPLYLNGESAWADTRMKTRKQTEFLFSPGEEEGEQMTKLKEG